MVAKSPWRSPSRRTPRCTTFASRSVSVAGQATTRAGVASATKNSTPVDVHAVSSGRNKHRTDAQTREVEGDRVGGLVDLHDEAVTCVDTQRDQRADHPRRTIVDRSVGERRFTRHPKEDRVDAMFVRGAQRGDTVWFISADMGVSRARGGGSDDVDQTLGESTEFGRGGDVEIRGHGQTSAHDVVRGARAAQIEQEIRQHDVARLLHRFE